MKAKKQWVSNYCRWRSNKNKKLSLFGSTIRNNGEIEDDVTNRINAGWLKWRNASGILCDKQKPTRLKWKFYRMAIRLALLYRLGVGQLRNNIFKMSVAEIRILRLMSGNF